MLKHQSRRPCFQRREEDDPPFRQEHPLRYSARPGSDRAGAISRVIPSLGMGPTMRLSQMKSHSSFVLQQVGESGPRVSVILPTRNRGTSVLTPIAAIRHGTCQDFEILVVDQTSQTVDTADAINNIDDPRIRHLPMRGAGLARALNLGAAHASAALIAVTGDDCEPDPEWLERIIAAFVDDPTVGIVHGNVEPCLYDPHTEFVQASVRSDAVIIRSVHGLPALIGTSANMAIRRVVLRSLAGFDEECGVGAPLGAAEEIDFVLRALASGWAVREIPTIRVIHRDVWPLHRRDELLQRNWFGTGAVIAKFARLHPRRSFGLLARLAQRWLSRSMGVSVSIGGGRRWARLSAFAGGFLIGLSRPLDRAWGHFAASSPRHRAG